MLRNKDGTFEDLFKNSIYKKRQSEKSCEKKLSKNKGEKTRDDDDDNVDDVGDGTYLEGMLVPRPGSNAALKSIKISTKSFESYSIDFGKDCNRGFWLPRYGRPEW